MVWVDSLICGVGEEVIGVGEVEKGVDRGVGGREEGEEVERKKDEMEV